jgi:hypothetical protein
LLLPVTKGGVVVLRRMTPGAIAQVVNRLAARAKVAAFSPHDLRRYAGCPIMPSAVRTSLFASVVLTRQVLIDSA